MSDILKARLIPSDQTVESRVGEETVLLHLENGTYYGLDAVGTRIWALLKDGAEPLAICETLAREFGIAQEVVEKDARRFLTDLKSHNIVALG